MHSSTRVGGPGLGQSSSLLVISRKEHRIPQMSQLCPLPNHTVHPIPSLSATLRHILSGLLGGLPLSRACTTQPREKTSPELTERSAAELGGDSPRRSTEASARRTLSGVGFVWRVVRRGKGSKQCGQEEHLHRSSQVCEKKCALGRCRKKKQQGSVVTCFFWALGAMHQPFRTCWVICLVASSTKRSSFQNHLADERTPALPPPRKKSCSPCC